MSLPETGSCAVPPRIDPFRFAKLKGGTLAILAVSWGLGSAVEAATNDAPSTDAARQAFFEEKIRPVLAGHCQSCHGPQKQEGGLRVDWREPLRKGGESGPLFEPGQAEDSLLIRVLDHSEAGLEMPKKAPRLPDRVVRDFQAWIASGAFDPREKPPSASEAAQQEWKAKLAERRSWWSLLPLAHPAVPEPKREGWANGPVDKFILARLEAAGLAPAPRADRSVLVRRLSFVLTGLPPSPEAIDAYLSDPSSEPVAYGRLVERLLASPHFGERWARHWMDVVRYGDTYGYEWDIPAKGAWVYRDYLVRAFNADVPFDQFVREQIAGDLLPEPRINDVAHVNESLIGPMFYQLGENRHGDSAEFDGIHQEMLHNKIDAFSKAFQGVTVGCARCHDHKLDAISQRDYYALAGAFMSAHWVSQTVDTPERNAQVLAALQALKAELRQFLATEWLEQSSHWATDWITLATATKGPWEKASVSAGPSPGWEQPVRAWTELSVDARRDANLSATWSRLAKRYAEEHRTRADFNAKTFSVVADFGKPLPAGWSVDGVALQEGPAPPGDFVVSLEGATAVTGLLQGGLYTNRLSPRLNGAIRTPDIARFSGAWVSLETCGGDFSAERTVVDNAFLTERQAYLARRDPAWSSFAPSPDFKGRRVFREVATKTSNPNFPPRIGLGGACSTVQEADARSWFGISRAVVHKAAGTPKDDLSRFQPLFDGPVPTTWDEIAGRFAAWLRQSVERWARDGATDDDVILINWMLDKGFLSNHSDDLASSRIRSLVEEYRRVEQRVLPPRTVNSMADLDDGIDYRLNVRGEYDQFGPPIPRGYLEVLAKAGTSPRFQDSKSGRGELAERVASPENPLTARVYVNRVWQWVFGTGLVATPDDFGHLGSAPTHPEILDFLAGQFIERGWSTKDLIRTLVSSATFVQGNTADPRGLEVDPGNRLLHHYPLRRLEAEEVRDAILSASGRLDTRLEGPPVDPHRTSEDLQKRLVSGPLDGFGRRSLYVKVTIMEPPQFLATFNQPPPKIPTGRRDVTSIPAQALTLLNDPFVVGQANAWGARMASLDLGSIQDGLDRMSLESLGRPPRPEERLRWETLVQELAREHGVPRDEAVRSAAVWSDVAHILFNTKEFFHFQ